MTNLNELSLKELTDLFNKYAGEPMKGVFKCSKAAAVKKVEAVMLSIAKADRKKASPKDHDEPTISKADRLIKQLTRKASTIEELCDVSGYDKVNAQVSISILRRERGMNIVRDPVSKTYKLLS